MSCNSCNGSGFCAFGSGWWWLIILVIIVVIWGNNGNGCGCNSCGNSFGNLCGGGNSCGCNDNCGCGC